MQPAQPAEGLTRTPTRGAQRPPRPLGPDVSAERQRLTGDLHDAVLQTLFAASLVTGSLSRHDALPDEARAHTLALQRLNQGALAGMRMLMLESRPEALASARLTELLQQASERFLRGTWITRRSRSFEKISSVLANIGQTELSQLYAECSRQRARR